MENIELALTLLIAGFVIVFVVLILLIAIITLYGKIIQSAQNAVSNKREKKLEENKEKQTVKSIVREDIEEDDGAIPEEIIAVIAAAVDAVYGSKPHKIKNIRRSRSVRSSWGNAGIAENTKPF
ncbi:MAG: OadG family protein [Clostridia bacterium]|nr:OadG family protein [Clostridia bacterium]